VRDVLKLLIMTYLSYREETLWVLRQAEI